MNPTTNDGEDIVEFLAHGGYTGARVPFRKGTAGRKNPK